MTRPWSRASTRTTSGPQLLDLRRSTFVPSVSTSSSLTRALRVQEAADVLRHLRDVLDEEQARRVTGCHWPECTKLGRSPTRPGSPRSAWLRRSDRRPWRRAGDDDRPLAAGAERLQVVAAGERLDLEPGVLGEVAELVRRHEPQRVAADPRRAASPWAPSSKIEVRSTIPLAASCWAAATFVTMAARLGVGRYVLEDQPAVEAGEVVGVGQPDVDDGEAARREMAGHRRERLALGVARREEEQRVEGDERQPERAGGRAGRARACRPRRARSAARRPRRPRRAAPGPLQHRGIDVDRRDLVAGLRERHGDAAGARRRARGSGRRSAPASARYRSRSPGSSTRSRS